MSLRLNVYGLSVDELVERAASVANLAMLRTYAEPSSIQIAAIDVYTPLLESKLESLHPSDIRSRDRIQAQLDIHRSILAPIRRLPVEILSYIFSLVAEEVPLRTLNIAVTLSRICIAWRKVAREHAELWTTVVVDTLGGFDEYCGLFLPLTKKMPLDLRCDDREILGDLWDRMAPYASRWRRITLEARLSMLPDLKVLYMERLERLVIFAYDAPVSTELSALDFVVAPRLRHVALTLDELQSERQLHIPVTRTLTSLIIEAMTPFPITHALPLLRACAGTLQSLTLKVRYPLEGPEGSYPTSASDTFIMESLTFLSVVDPACALLNHITAPHIEVLILSNVPTYGARSLSGFLTRDQASRHLIDLRVYKPEERDISAWLPCLQLMVTLTDLHFDDLLSKREFLEQLVVRHADGHPLLPSLQNVNITKIFFDHQELHDVIRQLCRSRAKKTQYRGRLAYRRLGWIEDYP
ncbi:hypothetical protein EV714DRAFT_268222 [Schizophyllum commune]